MARVEWVKQRLENWARWIVAPDSGGLGYPTQTAFAKQAGHGNRSEAIIPTDNNDARQVNEAVEALRQCGKGHLHKTLICYYVRGMGVSGTAAALGKHRSTINAHLEQADQALALWFRERADRGKKVFTS